MKDKILKVVVWRVVSIVITFCVLSVVTGNVKEATGITFFLHALLTGCHLAFETMWDRLVLKKEGKKEPVQ